MTTRGWMKCMMVVHSVWGLSSSSPPTTKVNDALLDVIARGRGAVAGLNASDPARIALLDLFDKTEAGIAEPPVNVAPRRVHRSGRRTYQRTQQRTPMPKVNPTEIELMPLFGRSSVEMTGIDLQHDHLDNVVMVSFHHYPFEEAETTTPLQSLLVRISAEIKLQFRDDFIFYCDRRVVRSKL